MKQVSKRALFVLSTDETQRVTCCGLVVITVLLLARSVVFPKRSQDLKSIRRFRRQTHLNLCCAVGNIVAKRSGRIGKEKIKPIHMAKHTYEKKLGEHPQVELS